MAKKRAVPAAPDPDVEVPVVGLREPCPCGSGRRYKACHGREQAHRGDRRVARPFAGLASECDWVALREIVPAATSPVRLGDGADDRAGQTITVATVLPMAWPALVRMDGSTFLGLQVNVGSGDPSRDAADALERAFATEPGNPVPPEGLPGPGPRLQDLIDPTSTLEVTVHDGFDFWLEGAGDVDGSVRASLERANAGVIPTQRLTAVEAAYWCRVSAKEHLRWVMPYDEEPMLDAMARLHARGEDSMGEGTRYVGSFRAAGLLVPVWDLPLDHGAEPLEEPAAAYAARLADAITETTPLTDAERRARSGLLSRQVTLR
jgi:hypothetical protein